MRTWWWRHCNVKWILFDKNFKIRWTKMKKSLLYQNYFRRPIVVYRVVLDAFILVRGWLVSFWLSFWSFMDSLLSKKMELVSAKWQMGLFIRSFLMLVQQAQEYTFIHSQRYDSYFMTDFIKLIRNLENLNYWTNYLNKLNQVYHHMQKRFPVQLKVLTISYNMPKEWYSTYSLAPSCLVLKLSTATAHGRTSKMSIL